MPKVPKSEALRESKLPVTEQNIRLLYRDYIEAKRRERGEAKKQ